MGTPDQRVGRPDLSMPGPTKLCSSDSWCWENPLPNGRERNGVWGADANNIWAVGGGMILKWNGTAWTAQMVDAYNLLYGVWGTAANNVWTVGFAGVILHKTQ